MNSADVIGYTTLDGEITCPDCTATQCDGSIPDDAPPIFADAETDSPMCCSICHGLLDGQSLTRDGRRYVVEQIAEYIADGRGDVDTLAAWSDLTDNSYTAADLEMARSCFDSIEGTYSHGTLRPQDLLEASIDAAQALHDWIACTPDYHGGDTRRCADLQNEMVKAEHALTDWRAVDPDDTANELWENLHYALESIDDTINAHLPAPLFYGSRAGDGSDIAIQISADY
jgi:uncharacterized protein (DUF433 family)